MHIVLAPDSYKGSASALNVALAMERGILKVFPDAKVSKVPIADGGEGTVEALVSATQGVIMHTPVSGPLGEVVDAHWGVLGDGQTAIIEMASASGLPLVPKDKRDPRVTTTRGTGELIKAALDQGFRNIIVGIGGSATNDGGMGLASALGALFLDKDGKHLPDGSTTLSLLHQIALDQLDPRLNEINLVIACDVDNPLCGERGASAVFGPQKGATPEMVAELDLALMHYAEIAKQATGRDIANLPGAGAAGGLGAGLMFFTQAKLRPGIDIVLDVVGFRSLVQDASFVITGEGCTDFQTAFGKAPVGVAKIAKEYKVPVFCISGGLGDSVDILINHGIDASMSICSAPMTLSESMEKSDVLISSATERLCRILDARVKL